MGVQSKIENKQEEFIRITILTTALQSIIIFCNAAAAPSVAAEAAVLNSQFAIWNVKAAADAATLGSEDRSRVATDYTAYNARHPYPTRIPITTHQTAPFARYIAFLCKHTQIVDTQYARLALASVPDSVSVSVSVSLSVNSLCLRLQMQFLSTPVLSPPL